MDAYDDGDYGAEDGLGPGEGSKGDKTQEEDDGSAKAQNEGGQGEYEGGDKEDDPANGEGAPVNNGESLGRPAQLPP